MHGSDPTADYLLLLAIGTGVSQLLGAAFVRPTLLPATQAGYRALDSVDVEDGLSRDSSPLPSRISSPLPHRTSSPLPSNRLRSAQPSPRTEEPNPFNASIARHVNPALTRSLSKERPVGAAELDISGWQLLRQRDFWLMFLDLGLCSGCGLMYINNIGTVARTLAETEADPVSVSRSQAFLVSALSVSNCAGRLLAGFTGDWMAHHAPTHLRLPRVWMLVPMTCLFVVSQTLARATSAVQGWHGLTPPTIVTGLAYGALFAISPALCVDRFGVASFGRNNGILTLAPAVFGNAANLLFGSIYDSHVSVPELVERASSASHLCTLGSECYKQAFDLTIGMSVAALAVAVVLGLRTSMH